MDLHEFHVAELVDEEGVVALRTEDEGNFWKHSRDHLMIAFQCDLCHVRNLNGQEPLPKIVEDVCLLHSIQRANFEAFWPREPTTVSQNLCMAHISMQIARFLRLAPPFQPMGPFPLGMSTSDNFSMGIMLEWLWDPGKHAATIQFSMMQHLCSMFSHIYHASAAGQGTMVMALRCEK